MNSELLSGILKKSLMQMLKEQVMFLSEHFSILSKPKKLILITDAPQEKLVLIIDSCIHLVLLQITTITLYRFGIEISLLQMILSVKPT